MKNKICFWKFLFFRKIFEQNKKYFSEKSQKFIKSEKSKIWNSVNFENFRKINFLFWSKFFRKNKNFQKQILFFILFVLCPCGVKFSSPRTGSKAVYGSSNKKKRTFFPKISTRLVFSDISFVIRLCSTAEDFTRWLLRTRGYGTFLQNTRKSVQKSYLSMSEPSESSLQDSGT